MSLTNKYDLPAALVNFATRDPYDRGSAQISVTELIDSPRVVELREAYKDRLTEDVSDKLWALVGRALHTVCEGSANDINHIVEERIFIKHSGWTLSGAIDVQEMLMEETGEQGELLPVLHADGNPIVDMHDYKFTSVYAVMNEKQAWENQINCYKYLIERGRARHVRKAMIIAILRDWRKAEAEANPEYPQAPIVAVPIRLWSQVEAEDYFSWRVKLHQDAREGTFMDIPDCSEDERWQGLDSWATIRRGGKRPNKVFDNEQDCRADVDERNANLKKGEPYVVLHRPGKRGRCTGNYCGVSEWCNTWQEIKRRMGDVDPEAV